MFINVFIIIHDSKKKMLKGFSFWDFFLHHHHLLLFSIVLYSFHFYLLYNDYVCVWNYIWVLFSTRLFMFHLERKSIVFCCFCCCCSIHNVFSAFIFEQKWYEMIQMLILFCFDAKVWRKKKMMVNRHYHYHHQPEARPVFVDH